MVRQPARNRRTKRPNLQRTTRSANHIANQPPLTRTILPRHNRSLRHPRNRAQRSLDLARLNPVPAQLQLRVRATDKLQHTIRAPPTQIPGPVHPAPRTPIRVRNKPLRRQTKPTQISPLNTQAPNVKLPHNPNRHRTQPEPST